MSRDTDQWGPPFCAIRTWTPLHRGGPLDRVGDELLDAVAASRSSCSSNVASTDWLPINKMFASSTIVAAARRMCQLGTVHPVARPGSASVATAGDLVWVARAVGAIAPRRMPAHVSARFGDHACEGESCGVSSNARGPLEITTSATASTRCNHNVPDHASACPPGGFRGAGRIVEHEDVNQPTQSSGRRDRIGRRLADETP